MNTQAVVSWVKSNVVIVICVVVVLAAVIGLPMVSAGWNAEIKADAKKRLNKQNDLNKASRGTFTWPGNPSDSHDVLITAELVAAFQESAADATEQSQEVVSMALEHNRADQTVLMPALFPQPADMQRDLEVMPPEMHALVIEGYEEVLSRLNAGDAPTARSLLDGLRSKRTDYIDRNLLKSGDASLTEEEQTQLTAFLSSERLASTTDRASEIGIYLTMATLDPPTFSDTDRPSLADMYQWQWRLWVLQRVADAIADINGSVAEPMAPIHRVVELDIRGLMSTSTPAAADRSLDGPKAGPGGSDDDDRPGFGPDGDDPFGGGGGAGGGPPGGPGGGPGGPGGPRGGPGGGGPPAGPAGAVPGPGMTDPTKSYRGTITNAMHDVVLVDFDLVVTTDRLDEVLDGFDRPGLMAILDVEVSREDAFAALREGYYYGEAPVVRVVMTVETIWFRAWTGESMPDMVRASLGLPPRPQPSQGASAGGGGA